MDNFLTDLHMHSSFSGDAKDALEDMVLSAIEKGCKYIAITEHCNNDYTAHGLKGVAETNLDRYHREFPRVKDKYSKQIEILYGIEIGYDALANNMNGEFIKQRGFDYVINSVHTIKGEDCYWGYYFDNRTQKEGYENYLNAVFESLSAPYRFNTIGHMGYITRNSPFEGRDMFFDHQPLIEKILKKMISNGVALEVNANICSAPRPCLPQREIIKLYKDLGGELIVYGSDAHNTLDICRSRAEIMTLLKDCGFKYHTVFAGNGFKQFKI